MCLRKHADGRTAIEEEEQVKVGLKHRFGIAIAANARLDVAVRHLEPKLSVLGRSAKFLPQTAFCVVSTAGHQLPARHTCGVSQSNHSAVAYSSPAARAWRGQLTYACA